MLCIRIWKSYLKTNLYISACFLPQKIFQEATQMWFVLIINILGMIKHLFASTSTLPHLLWASKWRSLKRTQLFDSVNLVGVALGLMSRLLGESWNRHSLHYQQQSKVFMKLAHHNKRIYAANLHQQGKKNSTKPAIKETANFYKLKSSMAHQPRVHCTAWLCPVVSCRCLRLRDDHGLLGAPPVTEPWVRVVLQIPCQVVSGGVRGKPAGAYHKP